MGNDTQRDRTDAGFHQVIIWITGAPGAGKTTTARQFLKLWPDALWLDGDEIRQWLTPDCDFSLEGRAKHAKRAWELASRVPKAIVSLVAHPPGAVDLLVWVDGPRRKPIQPWSIEYVPPRSPDIVVTT